MVLLTIVSPGPGAVPEAQYVGFPFSGGVVAIHHAILSLIKYKALPFMLPRDKFTYCSAWLLVSHLPPQQ